MSRVRAKPKLAQNDRMSAWEEDIQELLHRFDQSVYLGYPPTFATFRILWQEMSFSYIFETRPLDISQVDFIQSLYAAALDCLEINLRKRKLEYADTANGLLAEQKTHSVDEQIGVSKVVPSLGLDDSTALDLSKMKMHAHQTAQTDQGAPSEGLAEGDTGNTATLTEEEHQALLQTVGRLDVDTTELIKNFPDVVEHLTANEQISGKDLQMATQVYQALAESQNNNPQTAEIQTLQNTEEAQEAQEAREPDAQVVRVGSTFALWALFSAHPRSQGGAAVQIYVPLHLLRGLTWMAGQLAEVDAILRSLLRQKAFVIGACRRPISGSREARRAARPIKRVIRPDKEDQQKLLRQAVLRLKASVLGWQSLQHSQLLCNSYSASLENLWGSPQLGRRGLFDLDFGKKLYNMAQDLQQKVDQIFLERRRRNPTAGPQDTALQRGGSPSEEDTDDALQAAEAAAERRRLREEGDGDDMPSLCPTSLGGLDIGGASTSSHPDNTELQSLLNRPRGCRSGNSARDKSHLADETRGEQELSNHEAAVEPNGQESLTGERPLALPPTSEVDSPGSRNRSKRPRLASELPLHGGHTQREDTVDILRHSSTIGVDLADIYRRMEEAGVL